jgi:hypothetical protein
MGKVFSTKELLYDRFPKTGAHREAAGQIMGDMQSYSQEAGIEDDFHCMIYGSVGAGTERRRSDIDFIAVYPARIGLNGLNTLLSILKTAREQYRVPIEYNVISDKEATEGPHRVFPLYGDYLRTTQTKSRFVIGKPADQIAVPSDTASYEADMLQFLTHKRDAFCQAVTNYDGITIDLHRFSRALELSKALNNKYSQLETMGLNRLRFPPGQEETLDGVDREVTNLTEKFIASHSRSVIDAYEYHLKDHYFAAIQTAAKICLLHTMEYGYKISTKATAEQ